MGRQYDLQKDAVSDELLLYDAKDLTTHAVCVGMTGSGKTGLCVSLLEKAAIDGIPTIAIGPKGDIGNLLLTFPRLQSEDFAPWIDPDEAARKGMDVGAYASRIAGRWKSGLASWGQNGKRIAKFRDAADVAIYTPGSNAGLPVSVLGSFAAPPPELIEDSDALNERIESSVSGLLSLFGIKADPIRSREHILLSNILHLAWRQGRDLDMAKLIREIQDPPMKRMGVIDLESFFPAKDRFELAMTLNNLRASPSFGAWMDGAPLDIQRMLWTPEGKPRISIFSIAHLSETERMFFVTLLLSETLAWIRTQPGTTSLRALLYMDEVFGFFPPTADPPSKKPMLTMLKQARAYGLGIVLATQNPVDLDYKGLSNCGTWFLGRLQTERDKARVLDGLESVQSAGSEVLNRRQTDTTLSNLSSRVFLMKNVHEGAPTIFHTRWAMSYLRGPLTRLQIKSLMDPHRATTPAATQAAAPSAKAPKKRRSDPGGERPMVPPDIPEAFVVRQEPLRHGAALSYRPALLGKARIHFTKSTVNVDQWQQVTLLAPLDGKVIASDPWNDVVPQPAAELELEEDAESSASFGNLPPKALKTTSYTQWRKSLIAHLYRQCKLEMWRSTKPKAISRPGESEGDFRARLSQLARESRDLKLEKMRNKFAPKLARVEERIRKAEQRISREQSQYKQQKRQAAISIGATILGAMFGRKIKSRGNVGRASTSARGISRLKRDKADVNRAKEDLAARTEELKELEGEFGNLSAELKESIDPGNFKLTAIPLRPRKSDTDVQTLTLAWTPWAIASDGSTSPAYAE